MVGGRFPAHRSIPIDFIRVDPRLGKGPVKTHLTLTRTRSPRLELQSEAAKCVIFKVVVNGLYNRRS